MKKLLTLIIALGTLLSAQAKNYDNPDTLVVARDGTGEFRNVSDAIEVCRAFMDYHKVIFVKKGTYKEKIIIPQWLTNIEICGEDRDQTIITWDDHANITADITPLTATGEAKKIGTFRTFTLKIAGAGITLKNITIENNSARLGQAVALHTEGDRLTFINCRYWVIRTPSIPATPTHACSSAAATSRVLPTLSSVLRQHGLRTATYTARPTHTSPRPLHRRR